MTGRHVTNEHPSYAMVPEALLYDPAISDKAVRLYGVLRRHGDDPANCYPSKRRLATLMGCAPASIGRPLRELETSGWIERVARTTELGDPDSNGYHIRISRTSSAGSAQEKREGGSSGARRVGAQERAKRKPVEREPGNEEKTLSTPSTDPRHKPDYGFDKVWTAYPMRNGKRVGKAKALEKWKRFPYETKAMIHRAVQHYARAVENDQTIAKDMERFLTSRYWEDWVDGAGEMKRPWTPVDRQAEAQQKMIERNITRAAGSCETCGGSPYWEDPEDGIAKTCPSCGGN